jgi:hypothetical protein
MKYKEVRKHKRDRKNLSTDETQKSVFENRFTREKTCLARNETLLTRDETYLWREITKNSGETNSISPEMKPVSPEIISVRREIKKISLMFFSVLHPKTSNSDIIIITTCFGLGKEDDKLVFSEDEKMVAVKQIPSLGVARETAVHLNLAHKNTIE